MTYFPLTPKIFEKIHILSVKKRLLQFSDATNDRKTSNPGYTN